MMSRRNIIVDLLNHPLEQGQLIKLVTRDAQGVVRGIHLAMAEGIDSNGCLRITVDEHITWQTFETYGQEVQHILDKYNEHKS